MESGRPAPVAAHGASRRRHDVMSTLRRLRGPAWTRRPDRHQPAKIATDIAAAKCVNRCLAPKRSLFPARTPEGRKPSHRRAFVFTTVSRFYCSAWFGFSSLYRTFQT